MRNKKLISAIMAGLLLTGAVFTFAGCSGNAKPPEETEAQVEEAKTILLERLSGKSLEDLIDNDTFIKKFNDSLAGTGKKFTKDELYTDAQTGRMKASLDKMEISFSNEDVQLIDKGTTADVEPLIIWSANTIDSTVKESEVTKAFEKVKETDSTEVVGNVKIECKTENDTKTYTLSENVKTEPKETAAKSTEADKNKDKLKETASKEKDKKESTTDKTDKDSADKNQKTDTSKNQSTNNQASNKQTSTPANNTQTQQSAPAQETYTEPAAPQPSAPAAPAAPVHVHDFSEPIYSTVHHEATGHYQTVVTGQQWVVDQAAWDETETVPANICSVCGWYSTNTNNAGDMADHVMQAHNGKASYYVDSVAVGTIHHDEVGHYVDITEDQWVQDSAAYDSQEIVGYRCSCGATQ